MYFLRQAFKTQNYFCKIVLIKTDPLDGGAAKEFSDSFATSVDLRSKIRLNLVTF